MDPSRTTSVWVSEGSSYEWSIPSACARVMLDSYFALTKNVVEERCLSVKPGDRVDFELSIHSGHHYESPPCPFLKATAHRPSCVSNLTVRLTSEEFHRKIALNS